MRILWIKSELLHPVDKGGRIRTYQMLRALARRHDVTYLCLDDGTAAPDAVARAREYCNRVVTVPFRAVSKTSPAFAFALAANLFSSLPYAIARYRSQALRREIERHAAAADLVVCDFLVPAVNVPARLPARTVLFQHNVEAVLWERHASVPQHPLRRRFMAEQWRRMREFEVAECRRFDHVVAVSQTDADYFRDQYGVDSVSHVATGVDLDYFARRGPRPSGSRNLVFVGSMDWLPNDDGIRWFVEHVYDRVRAQVPDATLSIVGRSPSAATRALAQRRPGIEVTGTVDDVRPYLERAAVSIVPLRIGGGTRLKIYEAMAAGTPVVSTTVGAEGLPVRHGEHLLIADSAEEQAAAVVEALRNPLRAEALARGALDYVRRHCGWDAVAAEFLVQCAARADAADFSSKEKIA